MPEIRIDPLTGQRAIVAGDARRPPGRRAERRRRRRRSTPRRDPFAEGHEDRTPPELYAVRPAAARPTRPAGRCASCRTCTRRSSPDAAATPPPRRQPGPVLVAARRRGAHEVIVNAPAAGASRWPSSRSSRSRPRSTCGASGCAPTRDAAYVHLIVNERREAGASLPHTHAQLYALDFVPGGGRARARALRRLRDAHDGRQPARRPRPGGGAPARADRRDRRRGGADGAVRVAPAVPADARAARAARRASRTTARPARRCCTTALGAAARAASARARR